MSGTDFIGKVCSIDGNNFCADCGSRAPRWASVNLGVLLCINCSGIHRTLGVHLSQVKSLTLDNLKPEWIKVLMSIGNEVANAYYLHKLPPNIPKYHVTTAPSDMEVWIRNKYEKRIYSMDGIEEPCTLLAKGYNPRDIILNKSANFSRAPMAAQTRPHQADDKSRQTNIFDFDNQVNPVLNQSGNAGSYGLPGDFNPFSNETSQKVTDEYWPSGPGNNKNTVKPPRGAPNSSSPHMDITDPDKLRDAKIDAAKHSIAKLFQNPSQIGFKNSSYQQTKPNCVSDGTLDFDLSEIKEKLANFNKNL